MSDTVGMLISNRAFCEVSSPTPTVTGKRLPLFSENTGLSQPENRPHKTATTAKYEHCQRARRKDPRKGESVKSTNGRLAHSITHCSDERKAPCPRKPKKEFWQGHGDKQSKESDPETAKGFRSRTRRSRNIGDDLNSVSSFSCDHHGITVAGIVNIYDPSRLHGKSVRR